MLNVVINQLDYLREEYMYSRSQIQPNCCFYRNPFAFGCWCTEYCCHSRQRLFSLDIIQHIIWTVKSDDDTITIENVFFFYLSGEFLLQSFRMLCSEVIKIASVWILSFWPQQSGSSYPAYITMVMESKSESAGNHYPVIHHPINSICCCIFICVHYADCGMHGRYFHVLNLTHFFIIFLLFINIWQIVVSK